MVNPITNYVHIARHDQHNHFFSKNSDEQHELCLIVLYLQNKHLIRKAVVLLVVQFDFDDDDDT